MTDRDSLVLPAADVLQPALLSWYRESARDLPWRRDRDPYHVWVSEIMLQQTRVEAVVRYYERFLAALPTLHDLAAVPEDALLKLWEGLGYYSRARNLKKAAEVIVSQYGGVFPAQYDDIRALPGIGPYTAGAIASICFDAPTPAVDGNVLRVIARLTALESAVDSDRVKRAVNAALLPLYAEGNRALVTQALMELGACVCVPNGAPHCERCPWQAHCKAHAATAWAKYPVREQKKARRVQNMTVLLLNCGERYAIEKRPGRGLLAGLWQFPNRTADAPDPQNALDFASALGVQPTDLQMQTSYVHIFTHIEWHVTAFLIACRETAPGLTWVTKAQLEGDYALPSAFKPVLDLAVSC
ncbi:MAG: A/G-specific adenine glycosylase [Clostridia bacterium]|nr:A/G-specific adenine glycosylase [Clostridia bacterium]